MTAPRDPAETTRLAPLVQAAWEYHRGAKAKTLPTPGESPAARPGSDPVGGKEITERYTADGSTLASIFADVRAGQLGSFTSSDAERALELLDVLLQASLQAESELGPGAEAVTRVQAELPGLPAQFYGDVMDWTAYHNH